MTGRSETKKKEVTKCYTRVCTSKYIANYKYITCIPGKYYTIKLKLGQWQIKLQQNMWDKYWLFKSTTEKQIHTQNQIQVWHNQKGADGMQGLNEL